MRWHPSDQLPFRWNALGVETDQTSGVAPADGGRGNGGDQRGATIVCVWLATRLVRRHRPERSWR